MGRPRPAAASDPKPAFSPAQGLCAMLTASSLARGGRWDRRSHPRDPSISSRLLRCTRACVRTPVRIGYRLLLITVASMVYMI